MSKYARKIIEKAKLWLGLKESNGSFMEILKVYNAMPETHGIPLPRGHKMVKTDSWCAAFVSALALAVNYTDIIPIECSCTKIIEQAKKMGIWVEDESVTPKTGWLVLYDWDDKSGKADNKGGVEHIGIVEKVENGKITVIEGNYSDAVKRRVLDVNGKYLRGFVAPKYDEEPAASPAPSNPDAGKIKCDYAMEFHADLAGTYKAKGPQLRTGASEKKQIITSLASEDPIKCYGFHTGDHLLVELKDGRTGFIHKDNLEKI